MIGVSGQLLGCDVIARAALSPMAVELDPQALARAARSHEHAVELSAQRAVYGRSTGVGANRTVLTPPTTETAQALLASHATSAGPSRSADRVRAMLLIRLNQLCFGGSGIRIEVVQALARLINSDTLPQIGEFVGIGTGDLPALATTALLLQRESLRWGDDPVLELGPHDALAFISSNAATLADASLATARLQVLARAAVRIAALTYTALDGNPEAFSEAVEVATPFPGARQVCATMRGLIGSEQPRRIQDPFALRTLPQSHGVLIDALARLAGTLEASGRAPSENPTILPDGSLAHHGAFHAAYVSADIDAVTAALAGSAQLTVNRLTYLSEPVHTGLAAFLGDGRPGASGIMMVEYLSAAALGDLRSAAAPVSIHTVSVSRDVEDDATFASQGARQLLTCVDRYRLVLATELVAAVRAVRIRQPSLTPALAAVMRQCDGLPTDLVDRDLSPDLAAAQNLVDQLADPS